jgi:hypothetical protein
MILDVIERDKAFDKVMKRIDDTREACRADKLRFTVRRNDIDAIETDFSDLIETVNSYAPNGPDEQVSKDKFSKLVSIYTDFSLELSTTVNELATKKEF